MPVAVAQRESAEDAAAAEMEMVTIHGHVGSPQPVSAAQAEALGPALGPATDVQQSADPIDYSVSKEGTIRVAADETLGHYADWLAIPTASLRTLNHLKPKQPVLIGERIRLELRKVPSISETVDWARALILLHADALTGDLVRGTLNVILKFEQDIVAVEPKINDLLSKASEA